MNNNLRYLLNPFTRIAGFKAFFLGMVIVLVTVIVGWQSSVCFSGVLDAKVVYHLCFTRALSCQIISLVSLISVFCIFAVFSAKGTRFQDIMGTMTLSRFPYLFIALLGFLLDNKNLGKMNQTLERGNLRGLMEFFTENYMIIIVPLLMIPFSIWFVILLYNAFKVSTGLKGYKCGIIFTVSLVLAEILSLILIFTIDIR